MATSQTWADHLKELGIDPRQLQQPDYGVVGDLAGVYGAYTNGNKVSDAYGASADSAQQQAQALQGQMQSMPTLAAMYGQDSPYAKQMAMQLAAKDAAAGRNSQYGPRMQALQADLASKGSQYAQQQAAMANQYSQALSSANNARTAAATAQQQIQGQQLGSLFKVGQSSGAVPWLNDTIGKAAQPYINQGKDYLSNMFGTNQSTNSSMGPLSGNAFNNSQPEQPQQFNSNDQSPIYGGYNGSSEQQAPTTSNGVQGYGNADEWYGY